MQRSPLEQRKQAKINRSKTSFTLLFFFNAIRTRAENQPLKFEPKPTSNL